MPPFLLLLLAAWGSAAQDPQDPAWGERRVLDCTLQSRSFADCDVAHYIVRTAVWAVVPVVCGIALLVAFPVAMCGRYCCHCCGAGTRRPGFCVTTPEYPSWYSAFDLIRVKCWTALWVFCSAGGAVAGLVGTSLLASSLTGVQSAMIAAPAVIDQVVAVLTVALTVPFYRSSTRSAYTRNFFELIGASQAMTDIRDRFVNVVLGYSSQIGPVVDIVKKAGYSMFGVCLAVSLASLLPCILNRPRILVMLAAWLVLVCAATAWVVHGGASAVAMVVGDVCAEVDGVVGNQRSVVASLLQCEDAWFGQVRSLLQLLEASEARRSCELLYGQCAANPANVTIADVDGGKVFQCSWSGFESCASVVTFLGARDLLDHMVLANNTLGVSASVFPSCSGNASRLLPCTLERCADECLEEATLSPVGAASKEAASAVAAVKTIVNAADDTVAQYTNCDVVSSIVLTPLQVPCASLFDAVNTVRLASGFVSLGCSMLLVALCQGRKRFVSLSEAGKIIPADTST